MRNKFWNWKKKDYLIRSSLLVVVGLLFVLSGCSTGQNIPSSVSSGPSMSLAVTVTVKATSPSISTKVTTKIETTQSTTTSIMTTAPVISDTTWNYQQWLKGIPCRVPCWNGITPGKTSASEALQIFKKDRNIRIKTFGPSTLFRDDGAIEWEWIDSKAAGAISYHAQVSGEPVYQIGLSFPQPMKLGELMQVYGNPTHIIVESDNNFEDTSIHTYFIGIIYQSLGLSLGLTTDSKPTLSPETAFQGVVQNIPGSNLFMQWEGDSRNELPWQGFKGFDFYCRQKDGTACK